MAAKRLQKVLLSLVVVGLVSGALVLRMSGRRPAAFAFAAWCASGHMLFTTFFDFHTSTRLVPVFAIGVLGFQAGLLWLSFLFPEPPRWAGRRATPPTPPRGGSRHRPASP